MADYNECDGVFVDPLDGFVPRHDTPLHEQCNFGYYEDRDTYFILNTLARATRSLHNYAVKYDEHGGRHWRQSPTYSDLCLFYYGYAILSEQSLARKLQIKANMDSEELARFGTDHPNSMGREQLLDAINRYHRPRCKDMSADINKLVSIMKTNLR